ncbi:MAG: FxsA family protein [Solirubrobacteraceae bacterium]
MVALIFLVLWPVAELFVAIKVAEAIGIVLTVVLLLVGVPIGMWLTRTEGRTAWRRLRLAVTAGRPPGHEAINGALVLFGGLLLVTPGFITDAVGLFFLVAPTRALARRTIARHFRSRLLVGAMRAARTPRSVYDVDSTASDIERPHLHG